MTVQWDITLLFMTSKSADRVDFIHNTVQILANASNNEHKNYNLYFVHYSATNSALKS